MTNLFKRKTIWTLTLIAVSAFCFLIAFSAFNKKTESAYALSITQEEAATENVDSLRYGYNVTAGRPLCDDGLVTSAPILKPLGEGLYQHISKFENNGKTEAGNFIAYDALSIAQQSGTILSGGVNTNIKFLSLDVETAFDRNSSISSAYSERYETYYQQINRVYYIIQDTVDLREYLSESFTADLYNISSKEDAVVMLNKYGTHLFTGFQYGGMVQITNYIKTASSNVEISQVQSLSSKMNIAFHGYGAGASFSFAEQFATTEAKSFGTSNYKLKMYGGESVTAATLDQLFTYNASMVDGKGNYVYDRWVRSINDGVRLSIIGTPSSSRAIPLWDLLADGGQYNLIKSYLIQAYSELCGDKYAEYLEKYPTMKRTIGAEDAASGICDVSGYSVTYKGNTIYYSDENTTGEYNVFRNSKIFMNYTDSIPAGKKQWKIIKGNQNAIVLDPIAGVFSVNENALNKEKFTVGLYSDEELLYNREFTIIQEKFSGGDGTNNPYLISTKEDLKELVRSSSLWGKKFKLSTNIDLEADKINCLGEKNNPFSGEFDGNNCCISNFKIVNPVNESIGLFAYNSGTIKNLSLSGVTVERVAGSASDKETNISVKYAGGMVGFNSGNVTNCKVSSVTVNVKYYPNGDYTLNAGGLVGFSGSNSSSSGNDTNSSDNNTSTCAITECTLDNISVKAICNNGTSTAPGDYSITCFVGGLIGEAGKCDVKNSILITAPLLRSQAIGHVAKAHTGGLIGKTTGTSSITNCVVDNVQEPKATAVGYDGTEASEELLVGENLSEKVTNCYVKRTGNYSSDVSSGVTTLDSITYDGCDKLDSAIWGKNSNGYPVIQMQTFNPQTAISIDYNNARTEFYYGEAFNIAGVSVAGSSAFGGDAIPIDVFNYDDSKFDNTTIATYKIRIDAMGYSNTYDVTVRKIRIIGLRITPLKEFYYVGETPTVTDFKVEYVLEDGSTVDPNDEKVDYIVYPTQNIELSADEYVLGDNKITATCGNLKESTIIDATNKEITSLTITKQPNKLIYYVGQDFDPTGMEITATYSDNTEVVLPKAEIEVIGKKISLGENRIMLASNNYQIVSLEVQGEALPYNKYRIIFVDYDDSEISDTEYQEGDTVNVPENLVRNADNIYTYEFNGWDKQVSPTAIENVTYKATYTATYIDYTVTFMDWDNSIISTTNYHYGDEIEVPINLERDADNTYTYEFSGWDKPVSSTTTESVTYKATYTATYINYTVIFIDWDNSIISADIYHYGDTVNIPATPVRNADNTYTYAFNGWDKSVSPTATENVMYKATYAATYINYTITFVDWDNSIISAESYHYGDAVNIAASPARDADNTYVYAFNGWDKSVSPTASASVTYKATYTATYIDYAVTFVDWDNSIISAENYHYGDAVNIPENPVRVADNTYTYEFSGWDKPLSATVIAKVTYKATYTPNYINYNVRFIDWDGSLISSKNYHYNDLIVVPQNLVRDSDSNNIYVFEGWDATVALNCNGNAVYVAQYTSVPRTDDGVYVVYWSIGGVTTKTTYTGGEIPSYMGETAKDPDRTYSYRFIGWDKEIAPVTRETTYIAQYEKIYINYTVLFKDYDGSLLVRKTYHYNDVIEYPTDITRKSDGQYKYTFVGWDRDVANVTGDMEFTALYTREDNREIDTSWATAITERNQSLLIDFIMAGVVLVLCLAFFLSVYFIPKKKRASREPFAPLKLIIATIIVSIVEGLFIIFLSSLVWWVELLIIMIQLAGAGIIMWLDDQN